MFSVRANRAFLARAVRFLAAEAGIRQFLDIGTGIPTANNTHEVAQRAARTLDFSKPVAVMLIAVLHFIGDDAQARAIVSQLMDACVPGSFVVISHVGGDIDAEQQTEMVRRLNESVAEKATMRDRAGVTRLSVGASWSSPAWSGWPAGGPTPTSKRPAPPACGTAWPASPAPRPRPEPMVAAT